jgi:uncharacterized protein (DUF486 family)
MRTILLLLVSNTFMTFAWYGHLKHRDWPLWLAILSSWLIAFMEYCFAVPANRFGVNEFTVPQLKVIQEVITLVVFAFFAAFVLKESWRWNYVFAFLCLVGAVYFAFRPS